MDAEVVVLMRQARLVVIIPPHGPVMHDFCLNSISIWFRQGMTQNVTGKEVKDKALAI